MKGPGEDGAGGVTFRPRRKAKLRNWRKPREGFPTTSALGYDAWSGGVLGGIACTQRLTTLTGERSTSSRATHAAARVMRVDKALPKQRADAAVRRSPFWTASFRGQQLSRSSGDGRERETQRKETPNRRTMRTANRRRCDALSPQPGSLSSIRHMVKKHSPRHADAGTPANRTNGKTRKIGRW